MNVILIALVILASLSILVVFLLKPRKEKINIPPLPGSYRQILVQHVLFYQQLEPSKKDEFEKRISQFLNEVRITGVNTVVEDLDKVLIAVSAIIPIFNFPGWKYIHLHEVLLYPDSFSHDFELKGNDRHLLGMVGSGALNHVMILSQHQLRQAFINKTGKENVAIHEFVHLVDKTDGSIDGIPSFIMEEKYIQPWLELMQEEIKQISTDRSDINPYGSLSQAEFFAVASEYFFERPQLLKEKHPQLYEMLEKIFRR